MKEIITSRAKVLKILSFVLGKQAQNPVIIDIKDISHFSDYFIICSGTSERHTRAIYEEAIKSSRKNKIDIHHIENDVLSRWLLVDYFDVILHVFTEEARQFYNIERLWREAKKVKLPKNILNHP